jgi:hypothetical protein
MTEYSTPPASSADDATNATGGTTTDNDKDIGSNEDDSEDDSENDASDDNNGTEDALFHAAKDIQSRTSRHVGTAGMENRHFYIFLAQIYLS